MRYMVGRIQKILITRHGIVNLGNKRSFCTIFELGAIGMGGRSVLVRPAESLNRNTEGRALVIRLPSGRICVRDPISSAEKGTPAITVIGNVGGPNVAVPL